MDTIAIIDYGMGNFHSVARAIRAAAPQADVRLVRDPDALRKAARLVQPGQGAMRALGLFRGEVRRFQGPAYASLDRQSPPTDGTVRLKIPHMGWNRVFQSRKHALWAGIPDGSHFYFVHSYYAVPADAELTVGTSHYGQPFTCAIAADNIFAVQFHPEKSAADGLRLYRNFVDWKP